MRIPRILERSWIPVVIICALIIGGARGAAADATLFGLAHQGMGGASTLYKIDPNTGIATKVGEVIAGDGSVFKRCSGMDIDQTGAGFATCVNANGFHALVTIDVDTGIATEVGPTLIEDLEIDPLVFTTAAGISLRNSDNVLYAYLKPSDAVGTLNTATGEVTFLGESGVFTQGNGIAFSPSGELLHGNNAFLNVLDTSSGEATVGVALTFPSELNNGRPRINAMDFRPESGELFAAVTTGSGGAASFLATVDTATGEVTTIGPTVGGMDAIAWSWNETAGPLPFKDLWIKKANVRFSRHSSKYDRIEVRGKFILNDESDGIDLYRTDDLELVFGGSSVLIPAGSFAPIGSKLRFGGYINGMRVWAKIKEIHHHKYEFRIIAKGLDLMGFGNPSDVHLRIGDDAGGTNIRLKGTLTFRKHRKDRDRDKDKDDDDDDDDDKDKDDD